MVLFWLHTSLKRKNYPLLKMCVYFLLLALELERVQSKFPYRDNMSASHLKMDALTGSYLCGELNLDFNQHSSFCPMFRVS